MRKKIYNKYHGHCAYCGCEMEYNQMQVDHITAKYRNHSDSELERQDLTRGNDNIENYNPSCKSCNSSKSTLSIENFRKQLIKRADNLRRDSSQFRILERYGIIKQVKNDIQFYFEKINL